MNNITLCRRIKKKEKIQEFEMTDKYSYVFQYEFNFRFLEEQHCPANRIVKERTTVID